MSSARYLAWLVYGMEGAPDADPATKSYLEAHFGPIVQGATGCLVCRAPLRFALFHEARTIGKAEIETAHANPREHTPGTVLGFSALHFSLVTLCESRWKSSCFALLGVMISRLNHSATGATRCAHFEAVCERVEAKLPSIDSFRRVAQRSDCAARGPRLIQSSTNASTSGGSTPSGPCQAVTIGCIDVQNSNSRIKP